jgi:1-deoxy-D-xylulose-5-phosphate reductoisomerase
MRGGTPAEVKQIWLTASGGPFRNTPLADFATSPRAGAQAPHLGHGPAHHHRLRHHAEQGPRGHRSLPPLQPAARQVRVTVHPQSTVHSLVEYVDGSILAQISVTDMRLPILYALAYPERRLDLTFDLAALSHLDFQQPDFERFPCLRLAYEAAESAARTASPSTPPTRSPWMPFSPAKSHFSASRVQ